MEDDFKSSTEIGHDMTRDTVEELLSSLVYGKGKGARDEAQLLSSNIDDEQPPRLLGFVVRWENGRTYDLRKGKLIVTQVEPATTEERGS